MTLNALTETTDRRIKIAIWLYFLLWIFEGALRKWILPSLATPLLVVRDPVAIYILYQAFQLQLKFTNPYVLYAWLTTVFCFIFSIMFGHGNLFVGLYGARIMLLHFPILFIIGEVFDKEDVLKMGRVLLSLNILMTIIVFFQFNSPQTVFINVGIGGEGSAGFSGVMGYSRPPGTFSFTSGLSVFYTAVSVFVFYFWLSKDSCSKILLYSSTIALVIGLPLTISRGAVVGVVVVGLFAIIASGTNGKILFKLLIVAVALYFLVLVLQNYTAIFKLSTEVFMSRVDVANQGGGLKESIFLRALDEFINPLINLLNQPLLAGNLGLGTNAGAQILTGKRGVFLISEGEFGRLGGEQGLIFGGGLIALRIFLAIQFAVKSWRLPQEEKLLPFILCGAACIAMAQGQWAQPTILGYGILMGGFVMACFKKEEIPLVKN
ncbi:hypothetical protein ACNQF7_12455 [Flavobacterium sp. RSP29]|uniref:hypothetical protein n=1 Tax=Flavobacterium sp. RSP29 TaxID=3401731 RepID=UPI003AAA5F37